MAETEPVGLLTESAAGIAVVVLAIIALAGVSSSALLAIATIIVGVGLMVQGFNSAAENFRVGVPAAIPDFGGEVMVDCLAGGTGIVLGILALIGISTAYLLEAALIVFGGALLLSGAMAMRGPVSTSLGGDVTMVVHRGSFAAGGMEILIGLAVIVLGILSPVLHAGVLTMVGFIAVGASLLLVSATFGSATLRVFARTAAD
jgi:hypothetical protein